ncbi:hypothetical protein DVH24_027335 [Malus domestica]|uniref:Transmembrane protein n=1 Tax=Malus domestica TaxID=3750 RepID=A0A498IM58_MALDO|nr:hypothetical protein DVH24_027335 [Malus domestica]
MFIYFLKRRLKNIYDTEFHNLKLAREVEKDVLPFPSLLRFCYFNFALSSYISTQLFSRCFPTVSDSKPTFRLLLSPPHSSLHQAARFRKGFTISLQSRSLFLNLSFAFAYSLSHISICFVSGRPFFSAFASVFFILLLRCSKRGPFCLVVLRLVVTVVNFSDFLKFCAHLGFASNLVATDLIRRFQVSFACLSAYMVSIFCFSLDRCCVCLMRFVFQIWETVPFRFLDFRF